MFSKYLLNWSIKGHQGSKLFIKTAPSPKEASHSLTLHTPLCRRRTALAGRSISYPQCSALVVRFPNEVPSYTSSLPDILVFSLCWQFSSRFAQGAMFFFFFFFLPHLLGPFRSLSRLCTEDQDWDRRLSCGKMVLFINKWTLPSPVFSIKRTWFSEVSLKF